MSTLLMRFVAPMQAWGVGSKFNRRDTQREPTKSAVIGLIAAALGLPRDSERIAQLGASLRFGLRVDQEGSLLDDLHMAHEPEFWEGVRLRKAQVSYNKYSHMTYHSYLTDAKFLVGLQGESELLDEISQALSSPAFPLFLGRRSCPPEGSLYLGVRSGVPLEEALEAEPPLCKSKQRFLRIQTDAAQGSPNAWLQRDQPLSFDQRKREHGFRAVIERRLSASPERGDMKGSEPPTRHDAWMELEV